uniref:Reverse transcriptase n=1 Tax=Leptobrachium leishanense TaxID=445787 RepID=A0A8C5PFD7_9ANUR
MASKEIETFEQLVALDIKRLNKHKYIDPKPKNLSKSEYEGLKQLKRDETLIIKPADKGGGIVVLNQEQYHNETMRLLNDPLTYRKLENDPTNRIKEIFFEYIQKGKDSGILNEQEFKYLNIKCPRIPVFYHLPKVHKDRFNPPGRPIVSGINSISCRTSEYIDHLLQPLVVKTRAHLKDTISVLQLLQELKWENDYLFATCDVNSLYTIIPYKEGCEAVEFFLRNSGNFSVDQLEFT